MTKENNNFVKGIYDGLPICLGYLSVSFAFGIFAVASGLKPYQALVISLLNVTSAGQLAGVPIMVSGGSAVEMIISQFIINLRYALMSVSLSQKLGQSVTLLDRFLISFVNTDEVFAVASDNKLSVGKRYMYGLILTPYIGWASGTIIGAVCGTLLPEIVVSSLGVAIYGMFVAIVIPKAKSEKSTAACVLMAVLLSCAFKYIKPLSVVPSGFVIIICAVLSSAAFAILAPIKTEEEGLENG